MVIHADMANCTTGLGVLLISILILAPVNKKATSNATDYK